MYTNVHTLIHDAINAADSIGFAIFLTALIGFERISIENTILNSNSDQWYAVLRDAYRFISKYQIYITKLTFAYSYAGLHIFFQMFANSSLKSIVDARAKYVKFYHKNHILRTIFIFSFMKLAFNIFQLLGHAQRPRTKNKNTQTFMGFHSFVLVLFNTKHFSASI